MKAIRSKNFKLPIIQTQILDDGTFLLVDSKTTIRILDTLTLEVIDGFKAGINHLHYKNQVVCFSSDGEFFVTLSSDCKESRLYNAKTKKAIARVNKHHGEVSCVAIDPKNRYMFSSGDDGKTFVLDLESSKLSFTLPIHTDTVNDLAFSDNGHWVATVSYDRVISVFNLKTMTAKFELKSHKAPVLKASFLGPRHLCSVDKDSNGIIWDFFTGKVLKRLEGIHDDVTKLLVGNEGKFLFMGTQLGYLLLYDAKNFQLIDKKYLKLHSAITALSFDERSKELIVSCENGDILFYNIYDGIEDISTLLKEGKYTQIDEYVEENPILKYTDIYKRVSNLWENTVKKAKLCLQKGDKQSAIKLFSYFKNIPSKNKIMHEILDEFEEYNTFVTMAKKGNLALAYSLAIKHPMYKETSIYKSLEERWTKLFSMAQKYVLDPRGLEKAKEILSPYSGISEKTKLVRELFGQAEVYKRFRVAVGQKDFRVAFELVKLHPFLIELPEYTNIMKYADNLYIQSNELINKGETHLAVKILRILNDFPDFEMEVKELMVDIEAKQKFFRAVKDDDIVAAYNMLDLSDDLQLTEEGKKLQVIWNKDFEKANSFALEGNVSGVENTLEKYMKVHSKYKAIASVFGWCYMIQLENAIESNIAQTKIEEGIKNYILSFGLQDQILSFYKIFVEKYPKSKLNLELLTQGSLDMWRPSMVVNSILE